MRHSASPRNTRFVAVVVLFLWMLVLGSGVANACLSGDDHREAASHAYRPATALAATVAASAAQGRHAVQVVSAAHDACADCVHRHAADCDVVTAVAAVPPAGRLVVKPTDLEFQAMVVINDWQVCAAASQACACPAHRARGDCPEPVPVYLRFLRLSL